MNRRGVKPKCNREIITGIAQYLKAGRRWRDCPEMYGPHIVYNWYSLLSVQPMGEGRHLADDAGGVWLTRDYFDHLDHKAATTTVLHKGKARRDVGAMPADRSVI
jgi:transposase